LSKPDQVVQWLVLILTLIFLFLFLLLAQINIKKSALIIVLCQWHHQLDGMRSHKPCISFFPSILKIQLPTAIDNLKIDTKHFLPHLCTKAL